ncbi:MAG: hypothetical protein IJ733_13240, partial [Lachnospiraceae bacterium]|nr:hypothetical protein [Lachnospiraceae bacterium]
LSLMEEKAGEDTPVFSFPQEFIDHVLCQRGSGVEHGKFRIYSYFLQGHSRTERAEFLKKEYGIGGCSPIITGTGISESHDAKGIEFRKGYGDDAPRLLISWSDAAKRIDELIRADRYMTKQEIAFLPEYEKGILSAEIYYIFQNHPDNVIRPYPHRADYSMGMKAIRPQLDMPQRLDTIIQTMAEVLNNTADFARDYPSMQKAYHDILDYKAGTYSLFTPIPDERGGIETLPVPQAGESTENGTKNEQKENTDAEEKTISEEESAEKGTKKEKKENTYTAKKTVSDEAAEKDTEEKEPEKEAEVSETDIAFSESGGKESLAEKLNDLYKEIDYYGYVQNLELGQGEAEVIRQIEEQLTRPDDVGSIYDYLIESQKGTEPETDEYLKLENMIQEVEALPAMKPPYDLAVDTVVFLGTKEYQIDFISEKMVVLRDVEFPLFTEELDKNVFEERLRENPANDHLKIKEPIPFLPAEKDNILSENAGGFSEKQTEKREEKTEESLRGNAEKNPEETAQKEEKEKQETDAETEKKEQASGGKISEKQEERTEEKDGWISESDFPIGAELEMDGRKFAIDSVNLLAGSVSLKDITFQNGAGFPIFRSESIYVVKDILDKQRLVEDLLGKEKSREKQEEKNGEQEEEEQTETTGSSTEEIPEEELTTAQKNYRLLLELAPEVLNGEQTTKTFEAGENFMPLTIEDAGEDTIAVSHYYMEDDRSMADPDMEFFADHETESLHAMTFRQDNMNIFYNVGAGGEGSEELAEELNDFANQWFRNIKAQGYREIGNEREQGQEEQIENALQESATDDVIPDAEEDKRGQTEQGEPDTAERSDTKITPAFLQKKPERNMVYDLHPEIPQAERNQFHIANDELGYGTPREKFRKNIMAIQLLK